MKTFALIFRRIRFIILVLLAIIPMTAVLVSMMLVSILFFVLLPEVVTEYIDKENREAS